MPSSPASLQVKGIGNVPSMKNSKMLTRGRLITDPKKQKWMDQAAESFASQLRSWFQTHGIEIPMAWQQPSSIATSWPLDDSVAWIGQLSVSWQRVNKGEEGAVIEFTKLKP
jgi:hypothetical protein